jgi:hypothetical protein
VVPSPARQRPRRRAAGPAATLAALAAIGASAAAAAPSGHRKPSPKPPTTAQIRVAVRRAKHSPELWATVNVCNTAAHPDQIGIRGQVPGLGFQTRVSMRVAVQFYSSTRRGFEPTSATQGVDLGYLTKGTQQAGYTFPFTAPPPGQTYVLRGAITVRWLLGKKLLGLAVVHTKHGYGSVRYSDPPGYSAGTCSIPSTSATTTPTGTTPTGP